MWFFRDDDNDRSDDSDDDHFAITSRQKDLERRKMEETILAAAEGLSICFAAMLFLQDE